MKYRWHIAPAQPLLVEPLAARLGISPLLAQCLVNRGLSDPAAMEAFLEPRLKNLADPFLLPHMAAAVEISPVIPAKFFTASTFLSIVSGVAPN